ncbi:hypothetical protein T05_684 [Trichinella murrelli]|uniref:Uncharacterized protein n=1 Tax=Trichinella murrelli TaxID=144512 RepID=A0A0V0UGC8_9BILA|nr:hypothetical protein T05_684 [Trichinella murrelli]
MIKQHHFCFYAKLELNSETECPTTLFCLPVTPFHVTDFNGQLRGIVVISFDICNLHVFIFCNFLLLLPPPCISGNTVFKI